VQGYNSLVAGDSTNVTIQVGPTAQGPWIVSNVNFGTASTVNMSSTTASIPVRSKTFLHTDIPFAQYWRILVKSKGTAALTAGRMYSIFFPTVGAK
jgi:hypothetical protein